MDTENLRNIERIFKGIVYSNGNHEREVKFKVKIATALKWVNIVTTTAAIIALIVSIATSQEISAYVSIGFMALSLALTLIRLNFNPEEKLEKHRQIARELWHMREKYRALVADIKNDALDGATLMKRRDELINELALIYKFAPPTSDRVHKLTKRDIKGDDLPQLTPEDDTTNE